MKYAFLVGAGALLVSLLAASSRHTFIGHPFGWITASRQQADSALLKNKIPIDPARWYQLNHTSQGLAGLFDGNTDVRVETGWSKLLSSYEAYYPLAEGEEMTIESIRFFDGEGTSPENPMTLSVITDTWERIPVATFTGERYRDWVGPHPQATSYQLARPVKKVRYLVIRTAWLFPTEIELFGTYRPARARPAASLPKRKITLKQAFGVNAFEWDFEKPENPSVIDEVRWEAVKSFRGIRHYMDWEKLESKEGSYTYNPVHSGGWNYDAIYQRCKAEGIEVLACLKTLPGWMLRSYPEDMKDAENVPVRYGKDFSAPASYREQARVAFQYAARYGSNKSIDPALLSVNQQPRWFGDAIGQVKIGLGLVKYIECDNERDKWWKGRKAYQTAREYAANLSAFYDGHKNTMGKGVGVKNADPNMLVVMGGLAAPNTDYVRGMIDWCKEFRGYKPDGSVDLCWDIINFHLYANNGQASQQGNPTRGVAPELSQAAQVAQSFVGLARQQANGMPVWITEAGYDVHPGSPFKAIPVGKKSALQTQADWILRTSLLYARNGVERVFFYQLCDDNGANPGQFSSSGLINSDRSLRPAAEYLRQVNQLFGEYTYAATLSRDPLVDKYVRNGKVVYVLVVPDEKARTATCLLNLGKAASAFVYTPQAGQDRMQVRQLKTTNGKCRIPVTETPVFVTAAPVHAGP